MEDRLSKLEVEDFLSYLKNTVLDLNICINNMKQIAAMMRKSRSEIVAIENFLGHYHYMSYAYAAHNIYKMFFENEKRGFEKFFTKLEKFKYASDFSKLLRDNIDKKEENESLLSSRDEIVQLILKVKKMIEKEKLSISKVIDRRNTFYAHNDPNKKVEPEKLDELIAISKLAEKIFRRLYVGLLGRDYLFVIQHWSVKSVLDQSKFISEYYKNLENDMNGS